MTLPEVLFYVFGGIAILAAAGLVAAVRSTIAATLCLLVSMVSLAGIYLLLEAHLVAAIQVLVYAGGIAVLFLFVVMLLDLRRDDFKLGRQRPLRIAGTVVGVCVLAAVLRWQGPLGEPPPLPEGFGGYRELGLALYTDYVLLIETSGLLLLTAVVGALILTRKKVE